MKHKLSLKIDKKKLLLISLGVILILGGVGLWFWMNTSSEQPPAQTLQNTDDILTENTRTEKTLFGFTEDTNLTQYANQIYGYTMQYPEEWAIDTELAGAEFAYPDDDEDVQIQSGGYLLWSNYENMGSYTPETRPDDMFILALTLYQDETMLSGDLAEAIGFEKGFTQTAPFRTDQLEGTLYVSEGLTPENPRIAIILQEEDIFYVFHLAFINDSINVFEKMASVVKTFTLLENDE